MDTEDEMVEEHLDSDSEETISAVSVPAVSAQSATTVKNELDPRQLLARRKLAALMAAHQNNFQQALITSRRRCQQRYRQRRNLLLAFYVQQLQEVETSYMELLPLPGMSVMEENLSNYDDVIHNDTTDETQPPSTDDEANQSHVLHFYEDAVTNFSEQQWLTTFRMSKQRFEWLCDLLRLELRPNAVNSPLKNLIPLEKRVALALYAFATGADYRSIAVLFNVSRTSVCKFMKRFADAVVEKLASALIKMPQQKEEYRDICANFQQASNMPPATLGVLGLCEIPVSPPLDDIAEYTNEAGLATIVMQTLVDDRLLFRRVETEMKRPTMFLTSPNDITKLQPQLINERQVPVFAVTTPDFYPLRPWLMQRYEEPEEPHEYDFNEAIDNVLLFKEHAFRRLFTRWQVLLRKTDLEPATMERIAIACCALHNLLEEYDEEYLDEWAENVDMEKFNVTHIKPIEKNAAPHTQEALEIRNFLARTISSTEM